MARRPEIGRAGIAAILGIDGLQTPRHLADGVLDEALVILAPGKGDPRNAQAILARFLGQGDGIALIGQRFPHHFQADLVVIIQSSRRGVSTA